MVGSVMRSGVSDGEADMVGGGLVHGVESS
jgi:hypothetical protein